MFYLKIIYSKFKKILSRFHNAPLQILQFGRVFGYFLNFLKMLFLRNPLFAFVYGVQLFGQRRLLTAVLRVHLYKIWPSEVNCLLLSK